SQGARGPQSSLPGSVGKTRLGRSWTRHRGVAAGGGRNLFGGRVEILDRLDEGLQNSRQIRVLAEEGESVFHELCQRTVVEWIGLLRSRPGCGLRRSELADADRSELIDRIQSGRRIERVHSRKRLGLGGGRLDRRVTLRVCWRGSERRRGGL